MKIRFNGPETGSAMVSALIFAVAGGISLGAYLTLSNNSILASERSVAWNQSIVIAETGVEEALTVMQKIGSGGLSSGSLTNSGWTIEGSEYVKINTISDGTYYKLRLSESGGVPVIKSTGYYPFRNDNDFIERTVIVTGEYESSYIKGLVARGTIDLNGNNITTDSFDSSDPAYSTGGRYDASKAKDNGDIATNLDVVDSISIGNANIKGRVSTGPGGTVTIGGNGSVGNAAWHGSGKKGIQPGYSADDMNVAFPDVAPPFSGGAFYPGSGSVGGTAYDYVLSGGNYQMSNLSMSGQADMYISADSVLYVPGDFSMSGQAKIVVGPGVDLKIYVGGPSASIGGNGLINGGKAENVFFYGLPGLTSMSFSGNGEFTGVIYAPNANISMNGGGSGNEDFIGAGIFNSITMNGHFKFHYDEALGSILAGGDFILSSWEEI